MTLQPLYELKSRLEQAAIAGTGLLGEDFRLARAIEALAPLAQANKVFGKIYSEGKSLIGAPADERPIRLLDLLTLVDAVVYTQGKIGSEGEVEALQGGPGEYISAPYSALEPLVSALSGSGGGRWSVISTYWKEHPKYFSDFRVLPLVIKALGDNYGELSSLAYDVLKTQGKGIVPMLKEGFDPAGKREMARRVSLISELAGEEENEWFICQLDNSKKDIREELVLALGSNAENARLLIQLAGKERGKTKEAAIRAMAKMDDNTCAEFWREHLDKEPNDIQFLHSADSGWAAKLISEKLVELSEKIVDGLPPVEAQQCFVKGLYALMFNRCNYAVDFWKWAASKYHEFSKIKVDLSFEFTKMDQTYSLYDWVETYFCCALVNWPVDPMFEAAQIIAENDEAFADELRFELDALRFSASDLYDKYQAGIVREGLFRKESNKEKSYRLGVICGLNRIVKQENGHALCFGYYDFDGKRWGRCEAAIPRIDNRWFKLFIDPKISSDGEGYRDHPISAEWALIRLMDYNDPELKEIMAPYFYKRLRKTGALKNYAGILVGCGWKEWKGVLVDCCDISRELDFYYLRALLHSIPMSGKDKADELRKLDLMSYSKNIIKIVHNYWPRDQVAQLISQFENEQES